MPSPMSPRGGLTVRDLRVEVRQDGQRLAPVDGVDFQVAPGECVVLLGESGCGKSLTALALMRLLPDGLRLAGGQARLDEADLFALTEQAMRAVRGGRLAMIFQEPMLSLNPVLTVGQQIQEALDVHRDLTAAAGATEVERLLQAVGLEARHGASYPFQLSGGQRQRALIATMLAGAPELLIADEPTTALDVTVQAQILRLLKQLQTERGMGLLLITHDLDVARDMADQVVVMYAGQVVERASRQALYQQPFHPYTRKLFSVLPSAHQRHERLEHIAGSVPPLGTVFAGCRFAERCPRVWARCRAEAPAMAEIEPGHWARCHLVNDRPPQSREAAESARPESVSTVSVPAPASLLEVTGLAVHFPIRKGLMRRTVGLVRAVDGVSLRVNQGETLALVGESGCGKTTLARAVLQLIAPTAGRIRLQGEAVDGLAGGALRELRARMQIVFQDPFSSLNPRMRVGEILREGLQSLRPNLTRQQRGEVVADLLEKVGLNADAALRYPHAFSGGQRQRIAIARALAVQPRLLICDEPTSALDVSVQAQILSLLQDLQASQGLGYLFITHNLPVVGYLAHRVAVMYRGRIVEEGATEDLMRAPAHPYTKLLLDSAPGQGLSRGDSGGRAGAVLDRGCSFASRCPRAMDTCLQTAPGEVVLADGRRVSCHLFPAAGRD